MITVINKTMYHTHEMYHFFNLYVNDASDKINIQKPELKQYPKRQKKIGKPLLNTQKIIFHRK